MSKIVLSPYERQRRTRGITVLSSLGILILAVFIVSMNTGFMRLSPLDVLHTLAGEGTHQQKLILFEFRLPRIVISLLVGAGFAVSGCILQSLSRNALAEPGTLGINAGAGFAVIIYISFFPASTTASVFLLPLLALAGAGLTATLIYFLSYRKEDGLSPTRLILIGIAVSAGIYAFQLILSLRLDPRNYQFVATWIAGKIWGGDWRFVLALLPWLLILLPFSFYKARVLNVLNLGDQTSAGLGAPVEKERILLLAAAVALAGSCVAVSGGIGFVGLIAPHLARRLVGPRHQVLLPACALIGALLLLTADTLGRWVLQPAEIPTGIVVAIIGAPYFLYLLAKSKA
ncbi:FecCD family ABC transporter permease [Paenibacillus monticola]|uniref:Iron chelate uptake ABC transporter family permease subunit n=1 Tax=Paenibacillus monticola TaxID=2666075 RepID=A0A7X2H6L1_9BACL|nr:iron ABC transporter permease [Paenibacillus monticola]MRN54462.1 iron chelate uptake ABC transporter family permease subunit [Paenibacillus monticola]